MNAGGIGPLGQLLMIELEEVRWSTALERYLRLINPGGILFSSRHLRSPDFTAELLRKVSHAVSVLPFLALEEEGGSRDPLRGLYPPLPSPQSVAQKGANAVARLGELAGAALKQLGFNTNLAPLLDLAAPASEHSLGARAFSAGPHQVARCAAAFLRGLGQHGILPCAKYFPGSGEIRDSTEPPSVGKTMAELWRSDLVPYRTILARVPLVLIGHSAYKSFDYNLTRPASLSDGVVEGLLRTKLAYRGVAMADDLNVEAIRRTSDLAEAAVRSIIAGCDLVRVGGGEKPVEEALSALQKGLESGRLTIGRVEQSLARVSHVKKELAPPPGRISQRAFLQLARKFEDFSRQYHPPEQKIA